MDSLSPRDFVQQELPLVSPTKVCAKCGKEKSLHDDFYTVQRPGQPRGYRYICKQCDSELSTERKQRRKLEAQKTCAYPSCDRLIGPEATYCPTHFRANPEDIARRAAQFDPPPICAHPECGKIISRGCTHCREHTPREYSQATKDKMSASAKRRVNTPEGRANMLKAVEASQVGDNPFKGHTHTEETKAVIRQKRALQVITPESRKKQGERLRGRPTWNKGIEKPQEEKDRISATLRSKSDHLSQKGKERYARETEEERARRLNPWIQAGQDAISNMLSNTSIEVFVAKCLDQLGIVYETQKRIGYYIVDFYLPQLSIVLEANGCHWHACEPCGYNTSWHLEKRASDQKRKAYLERKGYQVKVIWEHEIEQVQQEHEVLLHCLLVAAILALNE